MRAPVKIADVKVTWANGSAANTRKVVPLANDVVGQALDGQLLAVFVRNPSAVTDLTMWLRHKFVDPNGGTTRSADLSSSSGVNKFTVGKHNNPPTTPEAQVFLVDGGMVVDSGGELVLENVTVLGGADTFDASVQVWAL